MATLSLLGEDGITAQCWEIGARPLSVGRDDSADVVIEDETLSRRHFLIVKQGTNYVLQDLDSQNGTWVDGRRARARATLLHHHDCIAAGRTIFMFSVPEVVKSQLQTVRSGQAS